MRIVALVSPLITNMPTILCPAQIITKIPLPDFAYRSSIRALEGISHTEAKQGSHATAMLRKWCLAMINLHRLIHVENI